MNLCRIDGENRQSVNAFILRQWFSMDMVVHGECINLENADGWVACEGEEIIGLITYRIIRNEMEILSLDSLAENRGIGTALLDQAIREAREQGCSRIMLITTNDNLCALGFYQRRGFDMVKLYRNAVDASRRIKPQIPLTGAGGIPIRHEIELEMNTSSSVLIGRDIVNRIRLTARAKGASDLYSPLEAYCLRSRVEYTEKEAVIHITADEAFEGVIRIAVPTGLTHPRFFLPGFIYGDNRGDAPLVADSNCPRLRMTGDFPASPWWMARSDRLSHPCAFAWGDGRLIGFAASPYYVRLNGEQVAWEPGIAGAFSQYAGYGCSLETGELWYTLGYENAPWFFMDSHDARLRSPLGDNCFALAKGERVTVRLHCFDRPGEDERSLHGALKAVYARYHEPPRRRCEPMKAIQEIATAVCRDAWLPERHSYSCFVYDCGDHMEYKPLPGITWTNGLSVAVPMLMSSYLLKENTMRDQALDCIDHIVAFSVNEKSGLPYLTEERGAWSNRGWWYDRQHTPGHAAYLVGQSVYYILKAYEWERRGNGAGHEDWLAFARGVIERVERTRNTDGEYPYIFSEKTGAGLEYDSFSGAWCLAAAALYCRLTGERLFLPGLMESERWYHDAYIRHVECYGGPLDIDKNVDSEGVLAYIRAARHLHEMTGEAALLDHMRDALYYEFTFKFCYNSPIKVPPLSTVGWSSCGGSITSVTNPHIHPMSSSVMGEMAYYLAQREDAYIQSRLEDTLLWSCQCHNTFDGEFGYGRVGWMSERFCHSEGLLKERWPDGTPASTWFALMPWAGGSLLEGLATVVTDCHGDGPFDNLMPSV